MKNRLRLVPLSLALAGLLVSSAACGAGGDSGSDGDKTLMFAVSTPETGPGVAYRGISDGTIAYLKWMNETNGLGGYKFEFVQVDNQSSVAGGASTTQRLLAQKPFLLDVITTPAFSGAAGIIKSTGTKTTVLAQASGDTIKAANLPHVFGMYTDYTVESLYLIDYAVKTLGLKNLALLHDTLGNEAEKQAVPYAQTVGGSMPLNITIPADATNMTSYVQRVAESGVQAVVLLSNVTLAANFVKSARSQGLNIPVLAFSPVLDQSFVSIAGDDAAAANFYVCSALPPLTADTPAVQEFKEQAPKYGSDLLRVPGEVGWNAGAVIAAAVRAVAESGKPMTNENFEQALYGLTGKQIGFTTVSIRPGEQNALVGKDGFGMYVVKNGDFVPANA
ncbi:ABC transporter substrate-binding protein [Plantactinospora solaniradicis]|uniref:ABC transporter substrate-binding protein n=1 Tax=Plantactinospora solaniradicis TaxID=1723736 RepID=A0ABW1KDR9_9ACTN